MVGDCFIDGVLFFVLENFVMYVGVYMDGFGFEMGIIV